ncbi:MAG: hypothetical protein AB1331_10020 [Bacillota bacterium]
MASLGEQWKGRVIIYQYNAATQEDYAFYRSLGLQGVPASILVLPNGKVTSVIYGYYLADQWNGLFQELLK